MSYVPFDYKAFAAARRASQLAGIKPVARGACHMCGYRLGPGALWCSTVCAEDYALERDGKA